MQAQGILKEVDHRARSDECCYSHVHIYGQAHLPQAQALGVTFPDLQHAQRFGSAKQRCIHSFTMCRSPSRSLSWCPSLDMQASSARQRQLTASDRRAKNAQQCICRACSQHANCRRDKEWSELWLSTGEIRMCSLRHLGPMGCWAKGG